MEAGQRIDETGLLVREGGAFYLRRDAGGSFRLDLHRMPIDEVEKQVRVIGVCIGPDLVEVDGVSLVGSPA